MVSNYNPRSCSIFCFCYRGLSLIHILGKIAKPTVAVITNVGTAHIGFLGSRENILKAKLEILENLKPDGYIVINNDNDMLNKWAKEDTKYKKYTFGIEQEADVMAYNIQINEDSSTYNVKINNEEYTVKVPVSGKHFVYNSLCAIAVGNLLKITPENIIKGIETFSLTKNRMEVDKIKDNITVINDAYNACLLYTSSRGPNVCTNNSTVTNSYYFSDNIYTNSTDIKSSELALYDVNFQNQIINSENRFNTEELIDVYKRQVFTHYCSSCYC